MYVDTYCGINMIITQDRTNFLIGIANLLPKDSTCVELGVADGIFSKDILNYLNPKQLFLIDPWKIGHDKNSNVTHYSWGLPTAYSNEEGFLKVKNSYLKEIESGKVIIKRGFSYEMVSTFPDKFFDFIYIDACHLYECVKFDLNSYFPKLKKNGLICGHDYAKGANFGVIEAVDEFAKNNNLKWSIKNENGGDWALTR
jgi:hypothetical protein